MSSSKNGSTSSAKYASKSAPAADKSNDNGSARDSKAGSRERPVSKYYDLIQHGVKPWDSDAKDFYNGLVQARVDADRKMDAMDAKHAR